MGGLLLWKRSYVLHTVVMPSSCGIFVYRLVTSIDTRIVSSVTFVFSMKLIKSVVSLRYEVCCLAIG